MPSQHGFAPHQVTVIPVSNEAHVDYAWEVAKVLRDKGVRVDVDERNEKLELKIRQSQTKKIPYQLIVGDKEMADKTVNCSSLWKQTNSHRSNR